MYIEPSAATGETDEDSAAEDNSFGDKIDCLSGKQLQVRVVAELRIGERIGGQNDEDEHPGNDQTGDRQSLQKKEIHRLGNRENVYENKNISPVSNHAMFRTQKLYQAFENNVYDDLLTLISLKI